jgi:hypothetical protein
MLDISWTFQEPLQRPYQDGKIIVLMSIWRVIEGAESKYGLGFICWTFPGHVSETLTNSIPRWKIYCFNEYLEVFWGLVLNPNTALVSHVRLVLYIHTTALPSWEKFCLK